MSTNFPRKCMATSDSRIYETPPQEKSGFGFPFGLPQEGAQKSPPIVPFSTHQSRGNDTSAPFGKERLRRKTASVGLPPSAPSVQGTGRAKEITSKQRHPCFPFTPIDTGETTARALHSGSRSLHSSASCRATSTSLTSRISHVGVMRCVPRMGQPKEDPASDPKISSKSCWPKVGFRISTPSFAPKCCDQSSKSRVFAYCPWLFY